VGKAKKLSVAWRAGIKLSGKKIARTLSDGKFLCGRAANSADNAQRRNLGRILRLENLSSPEMVTVALGHGKFPPAQCSDDHALSERRRPP